jgi:hypothetical protein
MGPNCIPKEAAGPYPLRLQAAAEPVEPTNVDAEAAAAETPAAPVPVAAAPKVRTGPVVTGCHGIPRHSAQQRL